VTAVEIITANEDATRAAGRRVGAVIGSGARIGLAGELGAGKTSFVRGLAEGLGVPAGMVRSPSFPILLPYEGGRLPLYHIDLFRLPAGDIDSLALREYIYGSGVCAIEWYERLDEPLDDFLALAMEYSDQPDHRRLVASAHGAGYDRALEELLKV
jgi:tRNA threonylcarbamoyladenosine biosynthesis protein TsaE